MADKIEKETQKAKYVCESCGAISNSSGYCYRCNELMIKEVNEEWKNSLIF
ncbi:MAG: hypothetical protein KBD53_11665 [Candidatus Omnitrophica bacterium]|nr:hypothetical protein [Candidatus Omnitrophota bacterium]